MHKICIMTTKYLQCMFHIPEAALYSIKVKVSHHMNAIVE